MWINLFWMYVWLCAALSAHQISTYLRKRHCHSLCLRSQPSQNRENALISAKNMSLATLNLRKSKRRSERGLFLILPMCMWGPAEAQLTEEWQSAGPGCWEDHMPLSTPAGCVGGGLASPRIGPESFSPGSQAGLDSAWLSRENDKEKTKMITHMTAIYASRFIST